MNATNKTLNQLAQHFSGETIVVLSAVNIYGNTAPMGLAMVVTPELLDEIDWMQGNVNASGAKSAVFELPLRYLWLQNRLRDGWTEFQIEDAILPFMTPELNVARDDSSIFFMEEGDDDSAGCKTAYVRVPALRSLLAGAFVPEFAQDPESKVFVFSEHQSASNESLRELQKGFYVDFGNDAE